MPPKKKMPDVPFQKPVAGQNPIFIDTPLYAHRKTDSASFTAGTPKNDIHASYRRDLKKRCPLKKEKDTRHTRKTSLSRCHPTVSTPKNDLYTPGSSTRISPPAAKFSPKIKKIRPAANAAGA